MIKHEAYIIIHTFLVCEFIRYLERLMVLHLLGFFILFLEIRVH